MEKKDVPSRILAIVGTALVSFPLLAPILLSAAVFIEERTVDVHIKRLRESLGEAAGLIETVRGAGYRFSAHHSNPNP